MTDRPIIRTLATLQTDMARELRDALHALYEFERTAAPEAPTPEALTVVRYTKTKIHNVLEYLTGARD